MNNVHISVDNSGVIYFTSESLDPSAWTGGVFKVTSTSTAQDLVGSASSWLQFPADIDFDDMGYPVILYFKSISSSLFEEHLAVYENGQWKDIAGDFSNVISPVDLESNNGLYFIYGDGTDLVNNIAASLKTIKLNH